MSTYIAKGDICSHFKEGAYDKHDAPARLATQKFFESEGWTVSENDGKSSGNVDFDVADLKITKGDKIRFIETEVKLPGKKGNNWKLITSGAHFTIRKNKQLEKHADQVIFTMWNHTYTEILIVRSQFFRLAIDWKNEYGHKGWENIPSSPNFVMPPHKCHIVRKFAWRDGWEEGDYISVQYKYITHINLVTGKVIHRAEKYGN